MQYHLCRKAVTFDELLAATGYNRVMPRLNSAYFVQQVGIATQCILFRSLLNTK